MKKLKILITIVIIFIIGIIVSIVILKSMKPGDIANSQKLVTPGTEVERPFDQAEEITRLEYNSILASVTSYIQTLDKNDPMYLRNDEEGNAVSIITEEERNEKIIHLLSKNYIEENHITNKNLQNYITLEEEQLLFVPIKMKGMNTGEVKTYAVEGITENMQYELKEEICFMVTIDYQNQTFSIEPTNQDYDDIETTAKDSIEKNDDNQYYKATVNIENITKDYVDLYKRLALAKPEIAYELFEEEYRNKRFGDLKGFEKYCEDNREEIKQIGVEQYLVNNYDGYSEYVAKDQYGNLYIFQEKSVLDFTMQLDTYTIPTEKFKEEYDKVNEQKKVMMNIDKWIQMLNNRDYKSAYEVLDETFKDNYFNTEEQFENIMRNTFPLHYKVQYGEFEEENNTYMKQIILTDITEKEEGEIQTTIIMQLKDDYQFVMSLGIE